MDGTYNPKAVEKDIFQFWREQNLFVPSAKENHLPVYSILMPPPNVTNVLHLGHALNNTLQDVMARYYRMQGRAVMWKIGVDHAGIATQNMVEKDLAKKGISRFDIGREKFLEHVWEWKNLYGHRILDQFKRLGVSGDWEHDRFTMDEVSSTAVKEIFVKLYKDRLLYRGQYLINWCPHCLTTISDDEVEHVEHQGMIYEISYPLLDSDNSLVVATTRPETILGDVALAVSPADDRYRDLVGKQVYVPLVHRVIPIIADEAVERDFGTGILKVTPGNDLVDFEIGKRHHLETIEMIDLHGKMNELAGEYKGMDRFEYRKVFVKLLSKEGFLVESKPHQHARGTCYRCGTVIENRISTQWFVKMAPLAKKARQALADRRVVFEPQKWEKVYFHWMDNIKDWSISRQLWWGHPIPAYYCSNNHINVATEKPSVCLECGDSNLVADPDVLDTWFSSWIWPFTVFDCKNFTNDSWKTEEFLRYYPTSYLATAPEILFFWVARMIMAGMYLTNEVPFTHVFFNSTVCDMQGRKMSKTLGNGIDPIDIIEKYGADALRFTLLFMAPKGERIRLETKSFETGGRLVNKLWNASRFVFSQKPDGFSPDPHFIAVPQDIWETFILHKYQKIAQKIQKAVESFDYYSMTHDIYHFFWNDFCDWFLESRKTSLKKADSKETFRIYQFLETILDGILRLFHPIMPFITEKIWQLLDIKSGVSLMKQSYALSLDSTLSIPSPTHATDLMALIVDIRGIRADLQLDGTLNLALVSSEKTGCSLSSHWIFTQREELQSWVDLVLVERESTPKGIFLVTLEGMDIYLEVPISIDMRNLQGRLKKNLKEMEFEIVRAQSRLSNDKFLKNASEELVLQEKDKIVRFEKQQQRILQFIRLLEEE